MEHWWNATDGGGRPNYWETKTCPSVTSGTNPIRTGLGSNPGLVTETPATNCLCLARSQNVQRPLMWWYRIDHWVEGDVEGSACQSVQSFARGLKKNVKIYGRQAYIWTHDLQNTTNFYVKVYLSIVSEHGFRL
jgi:hypothetical protein